MNKAIRLWQFALACVGVVAMVLFLGLEAAARQQAPLAVMSEDASVAGPHPGKRLFDRETFGGNGRTCRTCHSGGDGTIDPEEVAERLVEDPSDPLFAHDGLDDFVSGTTRSPVTRRS